MTSRQPMVLTPMEMSGSNTAPPEANPVMQIDIASDLRRMNHRPQARALPDTHHAHEDHHKQDVAVHPTESHETGAGQQSPKYDHGARAELVHETADDGPGEAAFGTNQAEDQRCLSAVQSQVTLDRTEKYRVAVGEDATGQHTQHKGCAKHPPTVIRASGLAHQRHLVQHPSIFKGVF